MSSTVLGPMISTMLSPDAAILVVDDDPKMVTLVRTYLEPEPCRVVTSSDGPRRGYRAVGRVERRPKRFYRV